MGGMEEGQEEMGERGGSRRTTGKMRLGWWDQVNQKVDRKIGQEVMLEDQEKEIWREKEKVETENMATVLCEDCKLVLLNEDKCTKIKQKTYVDIPA